MRLLETMQNCFFVRHAIALFMVYLLTPTNKRVSVLMLIIFLSLLANIDLGQGCLVNIKS